MPMKSRVAAALVAVAASAQALLSQQPPQRQAPPAATFRVQVDAVELDTFVTDAQGNPVTDLTVDDFEVLEDGKTQAIISFSLVNIPIERTERPLFAASPIEPDVQTNNRDEGRLYVIALDEVGPEQALRTRRFLHRFVERYFAANDVAAVVFLGRALGKNAQDFTGNRRLLLNAIDTFSGGFSAEPTPPAAAVAIGRGAAAGPSPAGPPGACLTDGERAFAVRSVMSSLRTLTEFMAGIRGRHKALLLFSQGFPVDMFKVVDYRGGVLCLQEEDAHAAIVAATRGNVTIYPIDPRGLAPDGGLGDAETASSPDPLARMESRSSLRALADVTGGFTVVDSNSFEGAFDRIVRENSTYYVLGFSSTNERRDGRYRRLQVRVKRAGLQVRARDGYVAPLRRDSAPATSKPGPLSASAADAMRSPLAVVGVPIHVFAAAYKGATRDAAVALAIEIDASTFSLVEKGGALAGQIEVGYYATDTERKVHPGQYHLGRLSLNPERHKAAGGAVRFLSDMHLPPGRYQVRVAAGNRAGKAGSVVYDIDVPDFSKGPLMMSGVALTSSSAAVVTTTRLKDPLGKYLPGPMTSSREFTSGDTLTLFAEVYENVRNAAAHTVDLTAELRSEGGRAVRTTRDERSSTELGGRPGGYGFTAELPLDEATPGLYVIHVEARSSLGARLTVSRDIQIRVR